MEVKLWDKTSNINSFTADEFMSRQGNEWMKNNDVILVVKGGLVVEVDNVNVIRSNLDIDMTKTSEEVANLYKASIEEMEKQETQNQITIEELDQRLTEQEDAMMELASMIGGNN